MPTSQIWDGSLLSPKERVECKPASLFYEAIWASRADNIQEVGVLGLDLQKSCKKKEFLGCHEIRDRLYFILTDADITRTLHDLVCSSVDLLTDETMPLVDIGSTVRYLVRRGVYSKKRPSRESLCMKAIFYDPPPGKTLDDFFQVYTSYKDNMDVFCKRMITTSNTGQFKF